MKKIFITLSLLTVFGLTSCSNDENATNETTTTEANSLLSKPGRPGGGVNIGIIKFEWGRDSKKCKGFGLCNVEWFPGPSDPRIPETPKLPEMPRYPEGNYMSPSIYSTVTEGNFNDRNEFSFELHMGQESVNQEKIPFIIEKDIHFTDDTKTIYTIRAGEFQYDSSIGDYGGYLIK